MIIYLLDGFLAGACVALAGAALALRLVRRRIERASALTPEQRAAVDHAVEQHAEAIRRTMARGTLAEWREAFGLDSAAPAGPRARRLRAVEADDEA